MTINELRIGNLVSYKGYRCEVKHLDTFRNCVYLDLRPYSYDKAFRDEYLDNQIGNSCYVNVAMGDIEPIRINNKIAEELNFERRVGLDYVSDKWGTQKHRVRTLTFRWDESNHFGMENVFLLDIDECVVEDNLKFYEDEPGARFELPNIRYVHQVQNLYFTITGKEL